MEYSEMFLLAWAMLATVLAIVFRHIAMKLKMAILVQQMGLTLIGEGKAKVVIEGDRIKVVEV